MTAGLEAESKQTPRIRVVPPGQAAAWPPIVLALPAAAGEDAPGTVPSAPTLMSSPVSEPLATLAPVTALLAILPDVTALAFSCLEPTAFLPRAAKAVPLRAAKRAMIATIIAGEGRLSFIYLLLF